MMRGSLQTIRDGVQRAQRDLASPNYRDIDARYRKQLIELKTTEMANSDLDKYHKVGFGRPAGPLVMLGPQHAGLTPVQTLCSTMYPHCMDVAQWYRC